MKLHMSDSQLADTPPTVKPQSHVATLLARVVAATIRNRTVAATELVTLIISLALLDRGM